MELPDDVLALICEYSRPLKRREISKFWKNKVFDLDLMAVSVLNDFIGWGVPYAVLHRDGNIWKIYGETFSNVTTA